MSKNRKMANTEPKYQPNVVKFERTQRKVELIPRNLAQEDHLEALYNADNRIVIAIGPAGTGKSYLSTIKAVELFRSGEMKKIIIVRPAVGAEGESHGYLPGTLEEKLQPWVQPIVDVLEEYYSKQTIADMMSDGRIEIASLMYLRGRSFKDSVVIFDESQNSMPSQFLLLSSRLGSNCRAFITGDLDQTDHRRENGLADFVKRLQEKKSNMIKVIEYKHADIVRDPIVAEVLRIYGKE